MLWWPFGRSLGKGSKMKLADRLRSRGYASYFHGHFDMRLQGDVTRRLIHQLPSEIPVAPDSGEERLALVAIGACIVAGRVIPAGRMAFIDLEVNRYVEGGLHSCGKCCK